MGRLLKLKQNSPSHWSWVISLKPSTESLILIKEFDEVMKMVNVVTARIEKKKKKSV